MPRSTDRSRTWATAPTQRRVDRSRQLAVRGVDRGGSHCAVAGRARVGGVRVDGSPDRRRRRTSSLVAVSASGRTREVVEAAGGTAAESRHRRDQRPGVGARRRGRSRPAAARRRESARDRHADVPGHGRGPGAARRAVARRQSHGRGHCGRRSRRSGSRWTGGNEWLAGASDRLDGAAAIDVVGDAADAGARRAGRADAARGAAAAGHAHDTGDWLHTAVYLALPGHRAVAVHGAATDEEVVVTIGRRGGETIVVGEPVAGAAQVIPLRSRRRPTDSSGRSSTPWSPSCWRRSCGAGRRPRKSARPPHLASGLPDLADALDASRGRTGGGRRR